jgi:chorismate synthase
VAAGAIAEQYLKQAYGIEIVAFVSSVGKIHLPSSVNAAASDDNDEVDEPLSSEFMNLIKSVTREEVDKFLTRCPHAETSEKMIQVSTRLLST